MFGVRASVYRLAVADGVGVVFGFEKTGSPSLGVKSFSLSATVDASGFALAGAEVFALVAGLAVAEAVGFAKAFGGIL